MSDDEKEIKNGLIINGKKITSISGPTSFYYLRPSKQVYEDGNKEYFPLVILLGDYHFYNKNQCDPCVCGYEYVSDKPCCYRLDDNLFISKLNRLGEKYAVDFYSETFFGGTMEGFKGGMMKEFTTGALLRCYKKDKRLCPWKNIRWQAGDLRFAGYDIRKIEYPSQKYMENSYIESQIFYLLLLLQQQDFNRFNSFIAKSYFRDVIYFRNFLMSLFSKDKNEFNINKFSKLFFSFMDKDNSAIYKQIKKQTFRNFNEIGEWEDFYVRSLKFYINFMKDYMIYKREEDNINYMRFYIYHIPEYVSKKTEIPDIKLFKKMIKDYSHIVSSSFLDIYVISRMFKQPENGKRSEISFCYLGDGHVINIRNLLLSTGAYELVVSKDRKMVGIEDDDNEKVNRCIDLSDIYINLNEELDRY